ncbi:MAG TPA: universal stress protein [Egibacteraceae bacterium]|nr:universal stress protein [Egibacteraceae bacterium]
MAFGTTVLVPVSNPRSAYTLLELAASLAERDGLVVPVTVLRPDAPAAERETAHELVVSAEVTARRAGVEARGMLDVDESVARGVLDTARECEATLVVMGWQGRSSHQNVFGSLIDSIAGRSAVPLAVARLGEKSFSRLLLPVSDDHLGSAATGGIRLAAALVRRLHETTGAPVRVVRSGESTVDLPAEVAALSDRVHHDPRRLDLAVGAAARADDLVVVPVAPTVSGLRAATTHVAWAAPDASLLIALDVGPAPATEDLAPAVRSAGTPVPDSDHARASTSHRIIVSACLPAEADRSELLEAALWPVGDVSLHEPWRDERGRLCVRAEVTVSATDTNSALGDVMEALHSAPGFDGAEISYAPMG